MSVSRRIGRQQSITAPSNGSTLGGIIARREQEAYQSGLSIGFAWQGIQETGQVLKHNIQIVSAFIVATEGLPADWQGRKLRELLTYEQGANWDKHILNALDNFREAVRVGLPVLNQYEYDPEVGHPFNETEAKYLMDLGLAVKDGVAAVVRQVNPDLEATELKELFIEHGGVALIEKLEKMRVTTPSLGAKSEPKPITAYVLKQTRDLAELHPELKTRGDKMIALLNELKARTDVKDWQGFVDKHTNAESAKELRKRSVEVQVFARLDGMTRTELGECLKQFEKDNRRA